MRNESTPGRNGVRRRSSASAEDATPQYPDLLAIPRLGRSRADSLVQAGITSLDDLRSISVEDLARIKWIGAATARSIKQWVEFVDSGAVPAPASEPPAAEATPRRRTRRGPAATTEASTPRQPSVRKRGPRAKPPVDDSAPVVETTALVPVEAPAPVEAAAEVEAGEPLISVGDAVDRLKAAVPKKSREKKLGRQLKKVAASVAEAPQSMVSLGDQERQQVSEALDKIAQLLNDAADRGKLSSKKQDALGSDLKKFRKRLEKALGG